MIDLEKLKGTFNNRIDFVFVRNDIFQIVAPFYHEDGDMYEMFLRETTEGEFEICDMGTSLMKLSYVFDLNSDNKVKIFNKILKSNFVSNENGNLVIKTSYDTFYTDLMQFSTTVSKVMSLDILKQSNVSSMFYEYLNDYVMNTLKPLFTIEKGVKPIKTSEYIADYAILDNKDKPIYILGVNDNTKAFRTIALCLQLKVSGANFMTLAVLEEDISLASKDKITLTNVVDKQYTSFSEFSKDGEPQIRRMCA